jgi:hypothetical protein
MHPWQVARLQRMDQETTLRRPEGEDTGEHQATPTTDPCHPMNIVAEEVAVEAVEDPPIGGEGIQGDPVEEVIDLGMIDIHPT